MAEAGKVDKIDFKKELKHLYAPSKMEIIDVPEMSYLMIDGSGDPGVSKEYKDAIEALYPVSYALKFMVKKGKGIDYGVMPLEGLWWADDMSAFVNGDRASWKWTSMMMQPEFITKEMVAEALEQVSKKKTLPSLSKIRFERFGEGRSAQVMHLGPFSGEGTTVKTLHDFIGQSGYRICGKHHEIYMSDIRKVAPERMKTVIRQPIIQ
jgi:hypothetical protein